MKYYCCILLLALVTKLASAEYDSKLGQIFARLTVASYCKETFIDDWSCGPCKKYPNLGYVKRFRNSTNDTVGYIGVDNNYNATVLVFRGTMPFDIKNWISDINFLKMIYPLCPNKCEVHQGFYNAYRDIQNSVIQNVEKYTKNFGTSKIFVTGHSLGGALATHAVAHLTTSGYKVDEFYSLGSPRVGDTNFQTWFTGIFGGRFKARITHHMDPVPHLPLESWGFKHLANEIYYNWLNTNYRVCDNTGEDPAGSNQFLAGLNIEDHLTYFNIDYNAETLACQFD